jgi:hypothetical protein
MKKQILLISLSIILVSMCNAQFGKTEKQESAFSTSLSSIVADYKNNFLQIQSNELAGSSATNTFTSTICLPDALHCTIERYNSEEDKSASWQALLFEGENYQDAVKIYKSFFKQVRTSSISGIDDKPVGFIGGMEKPDENVRFTVSTLRLSAFDKRYKDFIASIEISNNMQGWEVTIHLYRKKTDTEGNMIQ